MMVVMAVREIRPGTYEQFRRAWQHDPWLPRYQRCLVMRHEDAEDRVLTMAFFDGTPDEYEEARDDPEAMRAEEARLHRIAEFEERVLVSDVYELVEEVLPPAVV